ncbi:PAI2B protein, partial [Brachypodius atriceps]|nr:PAI2B protein [Brachypodius atriceps]
MDGPELGGGPEAGEDPAGQRPPEHDQNPFSEYLWMENQEDFDRQVRPPGVPGNPREFRRVPGNLCAQVEEELREQEFLDRCLQEMLEEEEQRDWFIPARDLPPARAQLQQQRHGAGTGEQEILSKSSLNPDAKEFVPGVKY